MKTTTLDAIAIAVADYYNMEVQDLFAKSRARTLSDKRAIFHFLSSKHTNHSLTEIGEHVTKYGRERYNHATVIHSIRKTRNLIRTDKKFALDVLHLDAYITKHVIVDREKEVLVNKNIQLMLERWFEYQDTEYLECLSAVSAILYKEPNMDVIKQWIENYEGIHKTASSDS